MAILLNTSAPRLTKSVDLFTYRTVHGRTIVSRKITSNPSNTPKQAASRKAFGLLQNIATQLGSHVEAGFNGATYNRRRLAFISQNKDLLNYLKQNLPSHTYETSLHWVLDALQSPLFLGNVIASEGTINSKCTFRWDADGLPSGEILLPVSFERSDRITLIFAMVYEIAYQECSMVRTCSFTPGDRWIQTLEHANFLTFDSRTVPQLADMAQLPFGSTLQGTFMAAVVYREEQRSVARFSLVE